MLKTILIVVILFEILIIGHEFGHYITAKRVGIRVNEFSIGMGPAVISKQKGETLYSLRAFPIGGYVAMEGEDDESEDERSFNKKSIPQKMLVVSAGAVMNYLMAILILVVMFMYIGAPSTTIKDVVEGSPAAAAGIEAGDTIVGINGIEADEWASITEEIQKYGEGDTVAVDILKDDTGSVVTKDIQLFLNEQGMPAIGVYADYERNLIYSVKRAFVSSVELIFVMFESLGMLISGEASVNDVVGPVGIVSVMGDAAAQGVIYVMYLSALLSVNLAVVNLLPLPALDGGRLLFLMLCGITRKQLDPNIEGRIHYFGFVLLLVLMVVITVKDVNQFILH
ncbi:MAG: RIP metalloprotease RseP [Firmicutes bacterium]|nr:RIP metalloprotease RseP [Clostridiales bacterium]MBQ4340635.1 RIP metalloprotease RseP [Bacillota bacterium]